jgi:lipopolysaccharide transport system permease protein
MMTRLRLLYDYREMISSLVVRDLKVRYKNSALGFLWSLLNPLLLMIVFTVVFTVLLPNNSVPAFPVFLLCALLPWNFFSSSVMTSLTSIVGNGHLIKKVYFPREILPIASVISNFVNFLFAMPVLFLLIFIFHIHANWSLLYLPLIMLTQIFFALGVSLALAAVNVFYRDTGVIMEVVMQAWFFLTPVFYPVEMIPEWKVLWGITLPIRRLTYILNPMASIIASYRSVLYGFVNGSPPTVPAADFFARTFVTALLCLVIGYAIFARYSHRFGEEV